MASTEASGHLTTDELFRQHAGFVTRFLSRLGVPPDQLEDALQEVFLVVHRHGGYRPGLAKPTSYLANIAIRAAAKHRYRDGVARTRHSDAAVDALPSDLDGPAHALQVRQDLERLQRALAKLSQELCTTLVLVDIEGESCVSVAAGLGCPVGTIYWRLHQARKELRVALRIIDARRSPRSAYEELDEAQPVRSWMGLFGLGGFGGSEASRLLRLAREQPVPTLAFDKLISAHHELVQAGAELPAWASGFSPQSASLLAVLGAGPIAIGLAGAGVIATATLLLLRPAPLDSAHDEPQARAAAHMVEPAVQVAKVAADPIVAPRRRYAAALRSTVAAPGRRPQRVEERVARPKPDKAAPLPRRAERAVAPSGGGRVDEAESLAEADPTQEPATATQAAPSNRPTAVAKPTPQAPVRPERSEESGSQVAREVSDAELAEMRDIARAERLLSSDPQRALALTRAMQAGFPESRFREERAYLEVRALAGLGQTRQAQAKAAEFLRTYPAGLYSDRVRKAAAGEGR